MTGFIENLENRLFPNRKEEKFEKPSIRDALRVEKFLLTLFKPKVEVLNSGLLNRRIIELGKILGWNQDTRNSILLALTGLSTKIKEINLGKSISSQSRPQVKNEGSWTIYILEDQIRRFLVALSDSMRDEYSWEMSYNIDEPQAFISSGGSKLLIYIRINETLFYITPCEISNVSEAQHFFLPRYGSKREVAKRISDS